MAETKLTSLRSGNPGRLFWIIGLAVGIVVGGAVAVAVTNSASHRAVRES